MPRRTNEFQQVVLRIYGALSGTASTVEESVLLKEKNSEAEREVDVLVTSSVAGHLMRVAVECRDHGRDQDITWVDSLVGKYANLDVQKVVAISHTDFSATAKQKAAQHNIELLTLKEEREADWASKVGPMAFQFFGFRNRPMLVGLILDAVEQLKIEYTFEGQVTTEGPLIGPYAQFFLEIWQTHMTHIAGQKISAHAFSNWDRISQMPNTPRYCEIVESFGTLRTLRVGKAAPLSFDTVVWGVGTKYTAETLAPTKWVLGDKAASVASALDDRGRPVHITLVADQDGRFLGANVEVR